MAQTIIDDPAPLNPQTGFPFAVVTFPVENLVQMGAIGRGGTPETTPRADDSQHFEP
jgi:hypothetical protein